MYRTTVAIQINCRISNSDSIMTFLSSFFRFEFTRAFLICFENEFWRKKKKLRILRHRSFSRRETKKRSLQEKFLTYYNCAKRNPESSKTCSQNTNWEIHSWIDLIKGHSHKKRLEQNLQNNCCTVFRHQKEGKLSFFSFLEILNPELKVKNSSFKSWLKIPKINNSSMTHFVIRM